MNNKSDSSSNESIQQFLVELWVILTTYISELLAIYGPQNT